MERRDFLKGIIAAAMAPAFIKTANLLMPINPLIVIPKMPMMIGEYTIEVRNEEGMARIWGQTEEGIWLAA